MAEQHAVGSGHADSAAPEAALPDSHFKARFWTLTLGAIGVVYGDIGTSPLYAMRETVKAATGGHHGVPVEQPAKRLVGGMPQLNDDPVRRIDHASMPFDVAGQDRRPGRPSVRARRQDETSLRMPADRDQSAAPPQQAIGAAHAWLRAGPIPASGPAAWDTRT